MFSHFEIISKTLRHMAHDPSAPSKLLVPESRTRRNFEGIAHVLLCPSFPECMTD